MHLTYLYVVLHASGVDFCNEITLLSFMYIIFVQAKQQRHFRLRKSQDECNINFISFYGLPLLCKDQFLSQLA